LSGNIGAVTRQRLSNTSQPAIDFQIKLDISPRMRPAAAGNLIGSTGVNVHVSETRHANGNKPDGNHRFSSGSCID
jgi:hypothetical protein